MAGKNDISKGILLAFMTALISGVSVFVNGAAVKTADPIVYTALKNIGSFAFLGAVVLALASLNSFRDLTRRQWGYLVAIGIIGGSVPFAMFFWGLSLGGAAVSSFIYRSLFIFAGVFGYLLLKERPEPKDLAAGLIMLIGNALLVSGSLALSLGTLLVLGATVLWALEYTISRKILAEVDQKAVMVSRMLFGSLVLFGFLFFNGTLSSALALNLQMIEWLAITSLLLAGFVFSWYTSLRYIPVFKATAVLALGGIVTAALGLVFLGQALSIESAMGLLLTLIGAVIIVSFSDLISAFSGLKETLSGLVG